jgi:hypothetical protein
MRFVSIIPPGRDNGLPAASSYVALVDVDPPVADHVLELLASAGVPAVAEPLAGVRGPYQDTRPPSRPTERVHVDRGRTELAREVVERALPALRGDFHADAARRMDAEVMREADVERAFAAIVETYDTTTQDPVPRWSVLEDRDPDAPDPLPDDSAAGIPTEEPPPRGLSSRLLRRAAPKEDAEPPDPTYWPEEHFVPPQPPPLPETDAITRFAWFGLLGGPLIMLVAVLVGAPWRPWPAVLALGAFMGGFVTLVARMPDRHPGEDGDDGARV